MTAGANRAIGKSNRFQRRLSSQGGREMASRVNREVVLWAAGGEIPPADPAAREGQLPLAWRPRRGHETPVLLALSFNPLAGDRSGLRPASQPTMPSADFCAAVGPPCDDPSPGGHGADLLG